VSNSIRGRASLGADGLVTVRLLITHPMTIERVDTVTNQKVAAHFIDELMVVHKGDIVFSALWGQGVSQNPFLSFVVSGAAKGDVLQVSWHDNRGATDTTDVVVA
jgi:sulfur-oxidizing protein SoxZ